MVNMNAAVDKENKKIQKINGVIDSSKDSPCSSGTNSLCSDAGSSNNSVNTATNCNGTPQNECSNRQTYTNGASTKGSCSSVSSSLDTGGGPSTSKLNQTLNDNMESNTNCSKSGTGLLARSSLECHFDNVNLPVASQNEGNKKPKCTETSSDYDRNSSSEDEECCIYTYKGDSKQMADLPSSFFRLDFMPPKQNANSRNSSPDMDYLEMDFDPGPTNGRDGSSGSESDDERGDEEPFSIEPCLIQRQEETRGLPPVGEQNANSPTPISPLSTPSPVWNTRPLSSLDQSNTVWSPPLSPQRPAEPAQSEDLRHSPQPQPQAPYCCCASNMLSPVSIDENFNDGDTGTMVWKEQEATEKQVTQTATLSCGVIAVINTLLAMNVPYLVSTVKQLVSSRQRDESALLPEYLLSCSSAGATHEDLVRALHGASQDQVYARFFHMYPRRGISLTSWLSHWIRKGAVPIVTVNSQRGGSDSSADGWQHRMVYGVTARSVHLTDPLETVNEMWLWPQLASPPVLLVRRCDVLARWTSDTDLRPLACQPNAAWRHLNVLGQVVSVIRESHSHGRCHTREHLTIPASYSSGVTLAVLKSSSVYDELRFAPELPIDPFASR